MAPINPQDLLDELQFDIRSGDKLKAHLVLKHLPEVDASTAKVAMLHLNRAPADFVVPVLVGLMTTADELGDTAPMLREILFAKALDAPDTVVGLLQREVKADHRALLAELLGDIRHEPAVQALLAVLHEEQDPRVLRSVIQALGAIGDPAATTPVSEYLYSPSAELIIAAITALGQLATPTAIQRLAEKLGADPDLDILIIGQLAASQLPEALDQLNGCLSSQHAHVRNAAKRHLAEIGPKAVPTLIDNLRHDDPDLLIHTLNVLGDIGDPSAIGPIRKLLHNQPADANVRFAAYETLGRLPIEKGAIALARGLEDPVDNVRAAAASAIDANYTTVLAAGIKNLVRDEDPQERIISRTVIEAQCDTIFLDLVKDDTFAEFAVDYLSHRAHKDIRDHFVALLKSAGHTDLIHRIVPAEQQAPALKVYAVDDSKMILNIYRSALHTIGCEPLLFANPQEAVDRVEKDRPDFIFTDLNMPEMSGVDLIRAVRRHFAKDQLPIVMVTTQNECQDNEAAVQAGVNEIVHKPFTADTLAAAIRAHLPGALAA